jgi:hypothetical protein
VTRVTKPKVDETEHLLSLGTADQRYAIASDALWDAERLDGLLTPSEVKSLVRGTVIAVKMPGERPFLGEVRIQFGEQTYLTDEWLYESPLGLIGDGGPYTKVAFFRPPLASASIESYLRARRETGIARGVLNATEAEGADSTGPE